MPITIDYTPFLGVPFVTHGRNLKEGLDCTGLVIALYAQAGIDISFIGNTEYELDRHGNSCGKAIVQSLKEPATQKVFRRVNPITESLENGDVILMRWIAPLDKVPDHLGVFYNNRIIHTTVMTGVIVNRMPLLMERIDSAFRYIGEPLQCE